MIEPKSVKKISVGRPKTNKALQKLRVQTWFNAVAEASGKTAYELEKEFAPSTVDREDFNKQRARLWEKYRLGKTMPTIKEKKGGKQGVALIVEERYPGTLQILEDPIWILADPKVQITMDDLKRIYMSLDHEIRLLLLEDGDITHKRFWKKPCDNHYILIKTLVSIPSLSSFKGLLCLLREALLSQQESNFKTIVALLKILSRSEIKNTLIQKLSKINFEEFK